MFLRSANIISREGGGHVPQVSQYYQQRRRRPCSSGQPILSVEKEAAMFLRSVKIISREGGSHVPQVSQYYQ